MFSLYERKHFQPELSDFAFILGPIHAGKKALCRSKNTRERGTGEGWVKEEANEYVEKERNNLSKDEKEKERKKWGGL
jgi:hypothetical protein